MNCTNQEFPPRTSTYTVRLRYSLPLTLTSGLTFNVYFHQPIIQMPTFTFTSDQSSSIPPVGYGWRTPSDTVGVLPTTAVLTAAANNNAVRFTYPTLYRTSTSPYYSPTQIDLLMTFSIGLGPYRVCLCLFILAL